MRGATSAGWVEWAANAAPTATALGSTADRGGDGTGGIRSRPGAHRATPAGDFSSGFFRLRALQAALSRPTNIPSAGVSAS